MSAANLTLLLYMMTYGKTVTPTRSRNPTFFLIRIFEQEEIDIMHMGPSVRLEREG